MRILMVSDFTYPSLGGVEKHIHELGKALVQRGCEVHIATGIKSGIQHSEAGLFYHLLPVYGLRSGVTLPCYSIELLWLSRLHSIYNFDIVHCHQSYSVLALTGLLWARSAKLPTVFTEHSMGRGDVYYEMLLSPIRQCSLSLSQHTIFVSRECEENTKAVRHVSLLGDVYVIPNIIPSEYKQCKGLEGLRAKFQGWPTKRMRIAFVQRLVERKGTKLIAPFVGLLAEKGFSADVYVVGSGPMEKYVRSLPIYNNDVRLLFLGAKRNEDVRKLLSICHIIVIPSYIESFSMVLVEALQEGCIPVASNTGGTVSVYNSISETLANRCLCTPSARELCDSVTDLQTLSLEHLLESLEAASKRACTLYEPWVIGEQIHNIYENASKQSNLNQKTFFPTIKDIWCANVDYFIFKIWFIILCISTSIGFSLYMKLVDLRDCTRTFEKFPFYVDAVQDETVSPDVISRKKIRVPKIQKPR